MSKRLIGLHCFNWTFNGIKENAEKIKESGYDYILVSPVQGQKEMDWEWWKLYQPLGFRFIDNILGTKEEYESMIKACNDIGLKIVQDVVFKTYSFMWYWLFKTTLQSRWWNKKVKEGISNGNLGDII